MSEKVTLIIILSCFIAACANPLNRNTYQRYHAEGGQAEQQGNVQLAEAAYSRALANVYMGNLGAELESEALFNLGRMERFTGKLDASIEHLQKSLEIDESNPSSNPTYIQNTLAELSKTLLLKSELASGLTYLKRSINVAPVSSANPQVKKFIAKLCNDYTNSLIAQGASIEAETLKTGSCSQLL